MANTITQEAALAELTRRALPKAERTAAMREIAAANGSILLGKAELKDLAGIVDEPKAAKPVKVKVHKVTTVTDETPKGRKKALKPVGKTDMGKLSDRQREAAQAFAKAFRVTDMRSAMQAHGRVMRSAKA